MEIERGCMKEEEEEEENPNKKVCPNLDDCFSGGNQRDLKSELNQNPVETSDGKEQAILPFADMELTLSQLVEEDEAVEASEEEEKKEDEKEEEEEEEEITVANSPFDLHMKQIGIDSHKFDLAAEMTTTTTTTVTPPSRPSRRRTGAGGDIVWRDGVFLDAAEPSSASASSSASFSWWRRLKQWAPIEALCRRVGEMRRRLFWRRETMHCGLEQSRIET